MALSSQIYSAVARSADEAERIARGEDVTVARTEAEEEAAAAAAASEAMFEPGAKTEEESAPADEAKADADEAPAKAAKGKRKKKTEDA